MAKRRKRTAMKRQRPDVRHVCRILLAAAAVVGLSAGLCWLGLSVPVSTGIVVGVFLANGLVHFLAGNGEGGYWAALYDTITLDSDMEGFGEPD